MFHLYNNQQFWIRAAVLQTLVLSLLVVFTPHPLLANHSLCWDFFQQNASSINIIDRERLYASDHRPVESPHGEKVLARTSLTFKPRQSSMSSWQVWNDLIRRTRQELHGILEKHYLDNQVKEKLHSTFFAPVEPSAISQGFGLRCFLNPTWEPSGSQIECTPSSRYSIDLPARFLTEVADDGSDHWGVLFEIPNEDLSDILRLSIGITLLPEGGVQFSSKISHLNESFYPIGARPSPVEYANEDEAYWHSSLGSLVRLIHRIYTHQNYQSYSGSTELKSNLRSTTEAQAKNLIEDPFRILPVLYIPPKIANEDPDWADNAVNFFASKAFVITKSASQTTSPEASAYLRDEENVLVFPAGIGEAQDWSLIGTFPPPSSPNEVETFVHYMDSILASAIAKHKDQFVTSIWDVRHSRQIQLNDVRRQRPLTQKEAVELLDLRHDGKIFFKDPSSWSGRWTGRHDFVDKRLGSAVEFSSLYERVVNRGHGAWPVGLKFRAESQRKWTEEAIQEECHKYEFLNDFAREASGAYRAAQKYGLLEKLCGDLERLGNQRERFIYAIKKDDSIYIGISYRPYYRFEQHKTNSREVIRELIAEGGELRITGPYPVERAIKLEMELIQNAKKLGYKVLNQSKGGETGGSDVYWTDEEIEKAAKSSSTLKEFRERFSRAYDVARERNILDKLCERMKRLRRDWASEADQYKGLLQAAKDSLSRTEFWPSSEGQQAYRLRLTDPSFAKDLEAVLPTDRRRGSWARE